MSRFHRPNLGSISIGGHSISTSDIIQAGASLGADGNLSTLGLRDAIHSGADAAVAALPKQPGSTDPTAAPAPAPAPAADPLKTDPSTTATTLLSPEEAARRLAALNGRTLNRNPLRISANAGLGGADGSTGLNALG